MPSIKESKLWRPPPRLMSDQLVNIYFQEWAPLFPILHRPSFLELYERYTSDPASVTDKCSLAQLSLVFGIAAASSEVRFLSPVLPLLTAVVLRVISYRAFREAVDDCHRVLHARTIHQESSVSCTCTALQRPKKR